MVGGSVGGSPYVIEAGMDVEGGAPAGDGRHPLWGCAHPLGLSRVREIHPTNLTAHQCFNKTDH
ncbi:hypothetical protein [Streptosporangium sp. NBC_01756]|uniref:hypothetical protein n=1 Tax=Streptosporangium sp. NBC_01756 TaxID=2975950 RepID=UPI002DD8C28B|nr:hypothetical protein [Streptosporangium sp. NBC_01756]WSC86296.1 hypothetical protein OIE48_39080 [Streptosporangium sp. NBC_01756]